MSTPRLRILHLAFEDPVKPGAGGGSGRTLEVNRRLAERHDITVVTYKYPGWHDRDADGVAWRHAGVLAGYAGSVASYFAALPAVVRRVPHDLVVEDFGAPIGSALVPLYARRPCVAMVNWLFAREMARKYRLPVHWVEALGVRLHRSMIAVSDELADRLRAANSRVEVDVIPNGVGPEAFAASASAPERRHLALFLGRLDTHQKGLDLLLAAYAKAAPTTTAGLVIAGDGPDGEALRQQAEQLGIADRVEFCGRVTGAAKYALLASAQVVCMPSRYEGLPLVAAEALACGTPVLASDIDCMREVVAPGTGRLLPPGDVDAWAAAIADALADPAGCLDMGRRGRASAKRFEWDGIALRQEAFYLRVVAREGGHASEPTGRGGGAGGSA
jgi:glycosyltransferase involved in cell wall biosynthesis